MSDIAHDYNRMIATLRELERTLNAARAVQFLPPPGGTSDLAPNGIPNPTLDTVIDPRRAALSQAIREAGAEMRDISKRVTDNTNHLRKALERWEGTK